MRVRWRAEPSAIAAAVTAACCVLGPSVVQSQTQSRSQSPRIAASPAAKASGPAAAASAPPLEVRAQEIRGRPDLETIAEGDVELRRGTFELRTDRLTYEHADDLAVARGHVRLRNPTGLYTGPELQVRTQSFEGFFREVDYEFTRVQAGGHAERIDFIDSARSIARNATYTSCPRDGSGDPPWVLKADRVKLDLDADEGIADGAVLRFYGVPILA